MDRILLSLQKRFLIPIVVALGLLVWLIWCNAHYRSYWHGTIYRVQTTDFNLLHHSLPQTLSMMIIQGRTDLVQKTLDSTYGLFGLVVTDPSGSEIWCQTDKVYHTRSWQDKVTPEKLAKLDEPFDYLTAPVELDPLYEHASPRSPHADRVSKPRGTILGRLYFVRADPPAFLEDMRSFLFGGFWELSGAKRGYLYISVATFSFSLAMGLIIWLRKRSLELKQAELDHIQRELEIRRKALEHLSNELAAQRSRKVWLEKEADEAYRRAIHLKKSLEKLRDSILGAPLHDPNAEGEPMRIRPPAHPPSAILEEIETLLPALSENAKVLRHQAGVLHEYCSNLEKRQEEMQRIVEHAYSQAMSRSAGFASSQAQPIQQAQPGGQAPIQPPGQYNQAGYYQQPQVNAQPSAGAQTPPEIKPMPDNGGPGQVIDMRPQ